MIMKKLTFSLLCLLPLCISLAGAAESTKKKTHLFVLSGQSNMNGLKPEVSFTPTVENAFGKENVIVVKNAKSGAPIRGWYKDYKYPDNREIKDRSKIGHLYDALITTVKAATAGKSYDTVTFIWMQGERDAKEQLSEVYADSFKGVIKQLQKDLKKEKINFVIGRISDFDMQNKKYQHWTKIREIQVKLADEAVNGTWVDTDDMNNKKGKQGVGGGLHYNKEGYKTLGLAFANKAIALLKD
jgi:hypothetical protein